MKKDVCMYESFKAEEMRCSLQGRGNDTLPKLLPRCCRFFKLSSTHNNPRGGGGQNSWTRFTMDVLHTTHTHCGCRCRSRWSPVGQCSASELCNAYIKKVMFPPACYFIHSPETSEVCSSERQHNPWCVCNGGKLQHVHFSKDGATVCLQLWSCDAPPDTILNEDGSNVDINSCVSIRLSREHITHPQTHTWTHNSKHIQSCFNASETILLTSKSDFLTWARARRLKNISTFSEIHSLDFFLRLRWKSNNLKKIYICLMLPAMKCFQHTTPHYYFYSWFIEQIKQTRQE